MLSSRPVFMISKQLSYSFFACRRYGLVEGALVKISCLEPAVSSDIRAADETVEAAEGQAAAENLAAAAEDETTDPALKVRSGNSLSSL